MNLKKADLSFLILHLCVLVGNNVTCLIPNMAFSDSHYFTPLNRYETKLVFGILYEEAVIPCIPTSPDVEVELIDWHSGKDSGPFFRYDPLRGFIADNTTYDLESTLFNCTFSKNGEVETRFIEFNVVDLGSYLTKPDLYRDNDNNYTFIGSKLELICSVESKGLVFLHWETPNPIDHFRVRVRDQFRKNRRLQTLTIYYAVKSDSGIYFCNVTNSGRRTVHTSLKIKIFDVNEYFLYVEKENVDNFTIAFEGEPSVEWSVIVKGHPKPTVTWLNNRNESIKMEHGIKYEAFFDYKKQIAFLRIKNIDIKDFGNFTLLASNSKSVKYIHFLNVTGEPKAILDSKSFHQINTSNTVECFAYANPEPEFQWYLQPCLGIDCQYMSINGTPAKYENYTYKSETTINITEAGSLKCSVRNNKGNSSAVMELYLSDIKNGSDIYSLSKDVDINEKEIIIVEGDTVTIICGASKQAYNDIGWFYSDVQLTSYAGYRIMKKNTPFSIMAELEMQHANITNSGYYTCRILSRHGEHLNLERIFRVESPKPPQVINSTLQDKKSISLSERLVLFCKFSGVPRPNVTWYKNEVVFRPTDITRVRVSENNEEIVFSRTTKEDEGTYKCEAKNRIGNEVRKQTVEFVDPPETNYGAVITASILLILVFIGITIFIVIKAVKYKQMQTELRALGLANFRKGAVRDINPGLGINEQVRLLPYSKKWEFPRERLKLGKQLGSGAFGVVLKGLAKKIVKGEDETIVAVKTVKQNADQSCIKALASELKIMAHLGKHLNVVNLLGACTKNVIKKELLIIVEFCRFGNLHNYLLRNRGSFIDQVNPETGKIDYGIGQESFDGASIESSGTRNDQSPINDMTDKEEAHQSSPDEVVFSVAEDTTVSKIGNKNSDWNNTQFAYDSDNKENSENTIKTICTKDLLTWAFQVSRGMEYLASRKVLHGDLATRNILLAENNIVKICDFGLAKNMYMYTNVNYTKKGDGPLPVKWLAIESIRDRLFSTQSDVWSFGIVLWELFSLAETPYPGVEVDERFCQKLLEGHRMEAPQFASKEIYKIMTDCWSHDPINRPSFNMLTVRLGCLLEDPVRQHYIDLNDPYLLMNTQQRKDGETDYLALLNPPTFEVLTTPHQVTDQAASGYQNVASDTIHCQPEQGLNIDCSVNNLQDSSTELLPIHSSASSHHMPLQNPVDNQQKVCETHL